jgi:ribosomal protein S18 acetylase RimI-like enzyme
MRRGLPAGLRRARSGDLASMADLLGELFGIETDFEARPERQIAGLRVLLKRRGCVVLVAEEGGEVVGMATMQTLVSTAEGGPVGSVEDLVVCSHFRGRGIGSKLIAALEDIARGEGFLRLQLLADERNAPAASFYAERGWNKTNMKSWMKRFEPC